MKCSFLPDSVTSFKRSDWLSVDGSSLVRALATSVKVHTVQTVYAGPGKGPVHSTCVLYTWPWTPHSPELSRNIFYMNIDVAGVGVGIKQ